MELVSAETKSFFRGYFLWGLLGGCFGVILGFSNWLLFPRALLDLVVLQKGDSCLLARPLHHGLDTQVVDVEGGHAHVEGRIDGVVGGLPGLCPVPSLHVGKSEEGGIAEMKEERGKRR